MIPSHLKFYNTKLAEFNKSTFEKAVRRYVKAVDAVINSLYSVHDSWEVSQSDWLELKEARKVLDACLHSNLGK